MLLKTKDLTKNFGGLTALNRVDFEINEGEIVAIIGPNGAGKSTFFNLISGYYPSCSGSINFSGKDMTLIPMHEYACMGIARTFQTTNLFTDCTVFDNLIIGYRSKTKMGMMDAIFNTKRARQDEAASREKAEEVLDFIELKELKNQPVGNISQEASKRLAIGLALVTEPRLLLLDEPTAGINHGETSELAKLILKIQQSGVTVCLIEHKVKMVMNLAHRIMVLNYGTKIAEGAPKEIRNNEKVIEAYLGGAESA